MTTRIRSGWWDAMSEAGDTMKIIPTIVFFMLHIVLTCVDTMGLIEYEYAESQRRSTDRKSVV